MRADVTPVALILLSTAICMEIGIVRMHRFEVADRRFDGALMKAQAPEASSRW
jgi:hypothetical protein